MKKTFALTLLCLLALAPAAEATWPGANGSIVFSRTAGAGLNSNSDLWIATRSGKQRRLTATPEIDETAPTFSPDGRTIAYVRREQGDADLWLMRSDGSDQRALVATDFDDVQPSFFPGGRSLAYTEFNGGSTWTVFTVRIDGEGRKRQAINASFPIVSPHGRLLAYSADGFGGGIRLLDLRTRKTRKLTTGSAQELDFSPDGRRILFTGQRRCRPGGPLRFQLLVVGLRDHRSRFLNRGCANEDAGAVWSPNGRKILYTHRTQRGRVVELRLRMMTASGAPASGAPRHLAGTQEYYPSWQPLG